MSSAAASGICIMEYLGKRHNLPLHFRPRHVHAHERANACQRVGVLGAKRGAGGVQTLQQKDFGVAEQQLLLMAVAAIASGNSSGSALQHNIPSGPPASAGHAAARCSTARRAQPPTWPTACAR